MEYGCFFITCLRFSRVGHPFFSKERSVLCVLFRSFKKNGTFFAFFSVLYKSMFQSLRSFLFLKKNVPFFSRVFGDLWDTKERSVLFRSFLKNERECKERNVLLQRTEKNAMFFCKERKRTQRSSAKNGKERENVSFFCKRTRERSVLFSIYI